MISYVNFKNMPNQPYLLMAVEFVLNRDEHGRYTPDNELWDPVTDYNDWGDTDTAIYEQMRMVYQYFQQGAIHFVDLVLLKNSDLEIRTALAKYAAIQTHFRNHQYAGCVKKIPQLRQTRKFAEIAYV